MAFLFLVSANGVSAHQVFCSGAGDLLASLGAPSVVVPLSPADALSKRVAHYLETRTLRRNYSNVVGTARTAAITRVENEQAQLALLLLLKKEAMPCLLHETQSPTPAELRAIAAVRVWLNQSSKEAARSLRDNGDLAEILRAYLKKIDVASEQNFEYLRTSFLTQLDRQPAVPFYETFLAFVKGVSLP